MAERRMFAKTIVLSDAFLDMPMSARCLYFTLSMLADDDGFVNSPKSIIRQCGVSDDDMKILIAKKYILCFEDGVIVIKHWRINNYLQSDRLKPTTYFEHRAELTLDKKGAYVKSDSDNVYTEGDPVYTQDIIEYSKVNEDRVDYINTATHISSQNNNIISIKGVYGSQHNVKLTDDEYKKLCDKVKDPEKLIEDMSVGIAVHGYKYKNHYLALLKWAERDGRKKEKDEGKASDIFG